MKNIKINLNGNKESKVKCDFKWQIEAITNILKNCIEHSNTNRMFIVDELPYGKANYSQRESEKGSIEFPFSHLERVATGFILTKKSRENAFPFIR